MQQHLPSDLVRVILIEIATTHFYDEHTWFTTVRPCNLVTFLLVDKLWRRILLSIRYDELLYNNKRIYPRCSLRTQVRYPWYCKCHKTLHDTIVFVSTGFSAVAGSSRLNCEGCLCRYSSSHERMNLPVSVIRAMIESDGIWGVKRTPGRVYSIIH